MEPMPTPPPNYLIPTHGWEEQIRNHERLAQNKAILHGYTIPAYTWTPPGAKPMSQLQFVLEAIASVDVKTLVQKDAEYGSSWKKRGGVGAFMMLARKWDRLETQATRKELDSKYDIFDAIEQDNNHPKGHDFFESTLETIRDLRRYLLLVESEIELRKQVDRGGKQPLPSGPLFQRSTEIICPHCHTGSASGNIHAVGCPAHKIAEEVHPAECRCQVCCDRRIQNAKKHSVGSAMEG